MQTISKHFVHSFLGSCSLPQFPIWGCDCPTEECPFNTPIPFHFCCIPLAVCSLRSAKSQSQRSKCVQVGSPLVPEEEKGGVTLHLCHCCLYLWCCVLSFHHVAPSSLFLCGSHHPALWVPLLFGCLCVIKVPSFRQPNLKILTLVTCKSHTGSQPLGWTKNKSQKCRCPVQGVTGISFLLAAV